jgi:RND family efflux transporter MFP subunit
LVEAEKLAQLRAQSTARIESTQAILKLRQSKLENLDSLVEKGHANPFEIEQAKSQFESAQADYRLAVEEAEENKLELEKIRAQIAQRTIRSPIDGVVTKLHKQAGEYIAGNSPIFATVVQLKKLKAIFYLDETTLGQLSKDQIVNVTVGLNATPAKGSIVYLSPIIDPQTGAGRVEIEIENQEGKLMSGVICQLNSAQSSTGNQPIPANVTSQRKRSNGVFPISNLPIRNNYR